MSTSSGSRPRGAPAAIRVSAGSVRIGVRAPVEATIAPRSGGRLRKSSSARLRPPTSAASFAARSAVRFTTRSGIRFRANDRPTFRVMAETPIRATAEVSSASDSRMRLTAISARDIRPRPSPVSSRTRAAIRSASSKTTWRRGPIRPSSAASSRHARTCPTISGSPRAAESSPAATTRTCSQAPSPRQALRLRSASPGRAARPASSWKASGRRSRAPPPVLWEKTSSTRLQVSR